VKTGDKKKESKKRKSRSKAERRKESHKMNSWFRNPEEQDALSTSVILNMPA